MSRDYAIGTEVAWTSHGRYGELRKVGHVVWIIPAHESVSRAHGSDRYAHDKIRKETSYIVEVIQKGKKVWYRPKVTHLRRISG